MEKDTKKTETEDLELKFKISETDSELVEKLNKIIKKELKKKK